MDELHYIYGTPQASTTTQTKEVKLRLPVRHLIRLHSLKLLSGQNISDTVDKALAGYFEKMDVDRRAARAARGPSPGTDPDVDATL